MSRRRQPQLQSSRSSPSPGGEISKKLEYFGEISKILVKRKNLAGVRRVCRKLSRSFYNLASATSFQKPLPQAPEKLPDAFVRSFCHKLIAEASATSFPEASRSFFQQLSRSVQKRFPPAFQKRVPQAFQKRKMFLPKASRSFFHTLSRRLCQKLPSFCHKLPRGLSQKLPEASATTFSELEAPRSFFCHNRRFEFLEASVS